MARGCQAADLDHQCRSAARGRRGVGWVAGDCRRGRVLSSDHARPVHVEGRENIIGAAHPANPPAVPRRTWTPVTRSSRPSSATADTGPRGHPATRSSRNRSFAREFRSWVTLALVAFCLLVGIPLTILLTPAQEVTVAGQQIAVGARAPNLSLSGPAQLVQIGNTKLDLPRLEVYGPLRPKLVMGPVQRNDGAAAVLDPNRTEQAAADAATAITNGFVRWYLWGGLGLLALTLAATAAAGYLRILAILKRQTDERRPPAAEVRRQVARTVRRMAIIAVGAASLAWVSVGALAYDGTSRGLSTIGSVSELVGSYHVSPSPVGPRMRGFTGAVIGDSRASRVGGPPLPGAGDDDRACERSSDSLAVEVGALLETNVRNLACSGASIATGLRGPQLVGAHLVPTQIGRLKQLEGLKFVVVVIGPNDLRWTDFMRYCYGVDDCSDQFTQGEFEYRLAAFDRDYGDLLQDLNELPDRPQVIVMTSYDVFAPTANCADTRGPPEAKGLNADKIELLSSRNVQLNDVLTSGAEKYHFDIAKPPLTPLCETIPEQVGADLQSLVDSDPFHPTAVGTIRMASAVIRVVHSNR